MPVARPEPNEIRVIAHVDLDCFYVQVEQRRKPELRGKPTGVVQYNPWKGGGLIAVGYEARQFGVKRNMRGDEAKKVCPEIHLIQVPVAHGKADLTQYRDAGSEVVAVLSSKGACERASIDEVYLDITEASAALLLQKPPYGFESVSEEILKTHILGHSEGNDERSTAVRQWFYRCEADQKDRMLACGAVVIAELRMAVLAETSFTCSAGIAHNKMLAKLASGMHKPAQQTLVPSSSVSDILAALPIKKMKQLGGKLGDSLEADLQASHVGDLLPYSESKLQDLYGANTGTWLWNIARGLSGDEVKARILPKSHSCGKTFRGPQALRNLDAVAHWLKELAEELQERLDVDLEQNHRTAQLLTLHAGTASGYKISEDRKFPSKSGTLRYGKEKIAQDALKLFERGLNDFCTIYHMSPGRRDGAALGGWAITSLFIGASNIWTTPPGVNPITSFFSSPASPSGVLIKEAVSPSSPLTSLPENSALDEPFSEHIAPTPDDEAIVVTCKKGHIFCKEMDISSSTCFFDKGVSIYNNKSYLSGKKEKFQTHMPTMLGLWDRELLSPERRPMEREGKLIENAVTDRCIENTLQSSLQDDDGRESERATCGSRCGNNGEREIDVFDSDELTCTPTFGNFGPVKTVECNLRIPEDTSRISYTNPPEVLETENSMQGHPSPIHCSPVEHRVNAHVSEEVIPEKLQGELEVNETVELWTSWWSKDGLQSGNEHSSQGLKDSLQYGAAATRQASGFLKLEEIWQRKALTGSEQARSDTINDTGWNYKQGEIDEAVLCELPVEIQEELYKSLGLKRPRIAKRYTIGDFFKCPGSDKANK